MEFKDWIGIFVPIIVTVIFNSILLLIGQTPIFDAIGRARLSYSLTDVLTSGNQYFQGVELINHGRRVARDVLLKVTYKNSYITGSDSESRSFLSHPKLSDGYSLGKNEIALKFDGVAGRSNGVIYLTLQGKKELPEKVDVIYNIDKQAKREDYMQTSWAINIFAIFGMFMFFRLITEFVIGLFP